jgi:hypothetical protein
MVPLKGFESPFFEVGVDFPKMLTASENGKTADEG